MITTWMMYAVLVGALLLIAASGADRAVRAVARPTRWVWALALAAAICTPFILPLVAPPDPSPVASSPGALPGPALDVRPIAAPAAAPSLADRARTLTNAIDPFLVPAWSIVSGLLLLRLAGACLSLRRRRAAWQPREIDGTRVFITDDLGPAVVAMPRASILIPEWALRLEPAHLSTIIRHEREHFVAGDARLLMVSSVLTALVPWNPAVWVLARRLRLAIEMDCDARVLGSGSRVDQYGSILLAIAQRPRRHIRAAAMLAQSTTDLERRITAMTERTAAPRLAALAGVAVASAALIAACSIPSPNVIAGPGPQEASTLKHGDRVARSDDKGVVYFDFQVTRSVEARPDNPPPVYPAKLRAANIGGLVVASFTVDAAGSPEMDSFKILKSDHDLFTLAVREVLPRLRFRPADVDGRPVRQHVQMPFVFSLSGSRAAGARPDTNITMRGTMTGSVTLRELDSTAARSRFARTGVPDSTVGAASPTPVLSQSPKPPYALARASGDSVPPSAQPNAVPPIYPNQLRAANVEGQVVARFTIGRDGTVDMSSFVIEKSDHDLFSLAVRNWAAGRRFTAGTVRGVPVDWSLSMPFVFSLAR